MKRGQHRRPNAVMQFLKKKPIQLMGIVVLAAMVVALSLPHNSYAAPALNNVGSDVQLSYAGQPDPSNDGINGGAILHPEFGSSELPPQYQGFNSEAKFYVDQKSTLQGPGGTGGAVPAWLLHFDITKTNSGATQSNNNGYLDIEPSKIDDWMANVDGYQGNGSQAEQQFDQFLKSQTMQDYADYATNRWGTNKYRVYDLPNLLNLTGAAFTGRNAGPAATEGPSMYWTYAPQCQVSVPSGQTIKAGGTFNFDGEAAIQTYHSNFHFEYVQVFDSNGQLVFDSNDTLPGTNTKLVKFANNYGLGGAQTGNGIYLNPIDTSAPRFTEVNGGNSNPANNAPKWAYWIDGNGEPTYGAVTPTTHDTITLPSSMANGTYTIKFYVSDWFNRVASSASTTTFTVGNGSNSGITLTASNTTPAVGTPVTLTAIVTKLPPKGDTYHIQIRDLSGSTLSGSSTQNGSNNVNPYSTSANSQTAVTENYTAYLVDTTTGNSVPSNQVTVTWSTGNGGGGGGGGGGGLCPAPYDKNEYWQANPGTNGGETFYWTYDEPYPVYRTVQQCSGTGKNRSCWNVQVFDHCDDKLTQMSQYYPATENQGKISGLSYDPGVPGNMWLPIPASQWGQENSSTQNLSQFTWYSINSQHGWDGFEGGGPNASQVSGTVYINGQQYHTWGPGQGSTPWAWARPASSFGFKMLWTGSPHSLPTTGTVTFTLKNPDGASKTWSEKLIINSETLQTQGTQMQGLNQPPPPADEVYSCAVEMIPKTVGSNNELAAWSLSSNTSSALANGAHINVTIRINTQNAGTITVNVPTMVALFNYPAWFFNQAGSVTIGGTTYTGTGSAQDGQ